MSGFSLSLSFSVIVGIVVVTLGVLDFGHGPLRAYASSEDTPTHSRVGGLRRAYHATDQHRRNRQRDSSTATSALAPTVKKVTLQRSSDGADIEKLADGLEININWYGLSTTFNIRAYCLDTESVLFTLDGTNYTRLESRPAYELLSEYAILDVGEHTLTVTPYSEKGGEGLEGDTVAFTYTVVNGPQRFLPSFEGSAMEVQSYPLDVGESQGALLGTELFSVGGFQSLSHGPLDTYSLDLSNENAVWRPMAVCPIDFWTHGAFAVRDNRYFYMCGGYLGAHPGKSMADCYVFDKLAGPIDPNHNLPIGSWSRMRDLPETRAGGGMLYIESQNALLFSLGAVREERTVESTDDRSSTWMLDLDDANAEWVSKRDGPYLGNHITAVTAFDCEGKRRYYILGGQLKEDEAGGNLDAVFEYLSDTDEWVEREPMPVARGHFSNSAVPYGCGFLIVGGAVDGSSKTSYTKTHDVSFYDIETDSWYSVGKWPNKLKTPLCALYEDALWCTNGYKRNTEKQLVSFSVPSFTIDSVTTLLFFDFDDPAVHSSGFVLTGDLFIDGDEQYTTGWYVGAKGKPDTVSGVPSGGLFVQLGGMGNEAGYNMSAGFRRVFAASTNYYITAEFDYQVVWASQYGIDEFSQVMFGIDGNMVFVVDSFNSSSPSGSSEWRKGNLDIGLVGPGVHYFDLGGTNNKKTGSAEKTLIYFDNVRLTVEQSSSPTKILDYDFNDPAAHSSSGFAFKADMFVDGDDEYTTGWYVRAKGKPDELTDESGGGLFVQLGGQNSIPTFNMSAGFRKNFTTVVDYYITVEFDYQVVWAGQYDADEYSRVICGIDGAMEYEVDFFDNSSPSGATDWRTAFVDVGFLGYGMHYFDLGGVNNKKNHKPERTLIYFDNVRISVRMVAAQTRIVYFDFDDPVIHSSGFDFSADLFVRGDGQLTRGWYVGTRGKPIGSAGARSGGLFVQLGGMNNLPGYNMSAGFTTNFTTYIDFVVTVEFDYQVVWTDQYESDELSRVMLAFDVDRVFEVDAFDSTSPSGASGWRTATVEVGAVGFGMHSIGVGGVNTKKDNNKERTLIYFDNIRVTGTEVSLKPMDEPNDDLILPLDPETVGS